MKEQTQREIEAGHTPLPWDWRETTDGKVVIEHNRRCVCLIGPIGADEVEDDAKFICRAANSHDALVSALGDIMALATTDGVHDFENMDMGRAVAAWHKAKAALDLAEKGGVS